MGRIVGIDLGTTYSAIGIPEERHEEGFFVVPSCPGVSIILDKYQNRLTPSVVAEDSRGNLIVGRAAKNRVSMHPEPVMFAKRQMGEDVIYQLDKQGELTPVKVSAAILRYLKEIAEVRLEESVDQVVISVPAYFNLRAKKATEEACKLAGLEVRQFAFEPVAAALAYCANEDRDPLRVMTYDLGGGTFDVAVLEKVDGTVNSNSILTFHGDRFLGGYNFDLLLRDWLHQELLNLGYRLDLDINDQKMRVVHAKLMYLAEMVKIKLSESTYFIFSADDFGLRDDEGIPISLEGISIERTDFERMIAPLIEKTIGLCHRALEQANPPIPQESLDEILLVGGSSRIPMIKPRLEAEFGLEPRLIEPDLSVALGAAFLAGKLEKPVTSVLSDDEPGDAIEIVSNPSDVRKPTRKSIEELQNEFLVLQARANEAIAAASPEVRYENARVKRLGDRLKEVEEALRHTPVEEAMVQDRLDEIEILVRQISAGWKPQPALSFFDNLVDETREMLQWAVKQDSRVAEDGYDRQIDAIIDGANKAYQAQNTTGWRNAYDRLDELRNRLDSLVQQQVSKRMLQNPAELILVLHRFLTSLEESAWQSGNYDQFHNDFEHLHRNLRRIDPNSPDALSLISDWYFTGFNDLKNRVEKPSQIFGLYAHQHQIEKGYGVGGNINFDAVTSSHRSFPGRIENLKSVMVDNHFPGSTIDLVHFSITSPPVLAPGGVYEIDIWAHLESQREEVIARAREAAPGGEIRIKSKGPVKVARGQMLTVRLSIAELIIDPLEDMIDWEGMIGNANFIVKVPEKLSAGPRAGRADIFLEGLKISQLSFVIQIEHQEAAHEVLPYDTHQFKKAFASYASQDRDAVLARIQGIQKAAPHLDIFTDIVSLRSGENWKERLEQEIVSRDILYLFWSKSARDSQWVNWEWRCMFDRRGIDYIDPVPLEPPDAVPPPPELAGLHFNDWVLAYMHTQRFQTS